MRLQRTLEPGARQRRPGFGGARRHDDLSKHGTELAAKTRDITMRHAQRPVVLGVDPKLVLVFELGAPVAVDEFRRAGLRVLDGSDARVVVAFADDPALAAFNERLEAVRGGVPAGKRSEPYAAFFDAIDGLRTLGPDDRIAQPLRDVLATAPPDQELRLDVECWHPEDRELAAQWLSDLATAVDALGGQTRDRFVHDAVGLLLARVYLPARAVRQLAQLDVVARIDVLPTPALSIPQLFQPKLENVQLADSPASNAPIVGIVDSGVRSAHPLLAGAVIAADALATGIAEGEDQHGHGTMVAALVLHGPIERLVAHKLPARPICRIVSARVLNGDNRFPDEDLWERDVAEAIDWCVAQGASIINLSIGNSNGLLSTRRQTSLAAVVDDLVRRLGIVVVTCTGNIHPGDYLPSEFGDDASTQYPEGLLNSPSARLIDPAPAMLALTVGGITTAAAASGLSSRESVARIPMGRPGWPSPVTRVGPGVGESIKPELVERAGTLGIESGRLIGNDPELSIISAGLASARLLGFDVGTSFAAPLVTRVAAAVKARFPDFSSNLVRAIVVCSAESSDFESHLESGRPSERAEAARRLLGYGRPSIARSIESTSHRVVLVAEGAIAMDGVHIYELPVPSSFFATGGTRGIDVALSYDPRTRARRLDYLSNRMEFHLVRGMQLNDVATTFARLSPDDDVEASNPSEAISDTTNAQASSASPPGPGSPSALGSRLCALVPPCGVRSRGANQLGRVVFRQRLQRDRHDPMYLVVRNVNRWEDDTQTQDYAIAAALWRSEQQGELHAELETRLEAVVELPVEIELEV